MSSSWPEKYPHDPESLADRQELDSLHKYSEFDYYPVNVDKAWDSINAKLTRKPDLHFSILWKVAAILVLISGVTFTVLQIDNLTIDSALTEVKTLENSKETYRLPDGSLVTLAGKSVLTFNNEDFSQNRNILFEGEGYFEIVKNNSAFVINTAGAQVKVLGTSFNLETTNEINLFVRTGLVSLQTSKASKKVTPGQLASTNKKGEITIKENTDPNVLSWKTGLFTFDNIKLREAFLHLEKYYNVSFTANQELASCAITAKFEQKSLEEVVEVLSTVLGAKSQINGKEVNFIGKGCK